MSNEINIESPRKEKIGKNSKRKKVVFIHLDLGIGGAEQLVLNLASAAATTNADASNDDDSSSNNVEWDVKILTTRCDPDHCFQHVKPPDGELYSALRVWGRFLPATILGKGTAFCSTIRMLYLALCCIWNKETRDAHVVVMDVLPTSIPWLCRYMHHAGILFYCHFPDKLLTRDTVNGEAISQQQQEGSSRSRSSLFQWYRNWFDYLEELTMSEADVLVVNSNFTKQRVQAEMKTIASKDMHVLYPSLQMESFVQPNFDDEDDALSDEHRLLPPIVSLNRFERKKNIGLLLEAYAELMQIQQTQGHQTTAKRTLPSLVIAGGYDRVNVENVEYLQELKQLASDLCIPPEQIRFRPNVSDAERSDLLTSCLCLVYTPHLEHFGIVPLECMYAGRPVVALASGGPLETIVHEQTGFLCRPPENPNVAKKEMAQNLWRLMQEYPTLSLTMGRAGHEHVKRKFGKEQFTSDWKSLLQRTVKAGAERRCAERRRSATQPYYHKVWIRILEVTVEFVAMLLLAIIVTWFCRQVGIVGPNDHIWTIVKRKVMGDDNMKDEL